MSDDRPKCKKYDQCLEIDNTSRSIMHKRRISKLCDSKCSSCCGYVPEVEIKDPVLNSSVLMDWILHRHKTKPVEIWEIEKMIECIRKDVILMMKIGLEDGWM